MGRGRQGVLVLLLRTEGVTDHGREARAGEVEPGTGKVIECLDMMSRSLRCRCGPSLQCMPCCAIYADAAFATFTLRSEFLTPAPVTLFLPAAVQAPV